MGTEDDYDSVERDGGGAHLLRLRTLTADDFDAEERRCKTELAGLADRMAVVRTMSHDNTNHVQACLPAMRRQRKGIVINLSSIVGKFTFPGSGIYAASKHALEAVTDDAVRRFRAEAGIHPVPALGADAARDPGARLDAA